MPPRRTPADVVADRLATWLGPHTARTAVRTFSERALGLRPEHVTSADVPRLLAALRPMLRTLLGATQGEALLDEIAREISTP
jgi:hypothetical protein